MENSDARPQPQTSQISISTKLLYIETTHTEKQQLFCSSTSSLNFLQAVCSLRRPTVSVNALKAISDILFADDNNH